VQDHRAVHPGPAGDPHPRRQHRPAHEPARHDRAVADHTVKGPAGPAPVVHELGRRLRRHVSQYRPSVVVQVEHGGHRAQVHVRVEIGIDRPHVPPVAPVAFGRARHLVPQEVIGVRGALPDQHRDDVAPHAVPAGVVIGVLPERIHQYVGVEHVHAHGGQCLVRARRAGRLLRERLDAVAVLRGPHDAEVRRLLPGNTDSGDRDPGAPGPVPLDHLPRIHPVHMFGPGHHHDVGPVRIDQAQRLVDGVRRAGLPVWAAPLLRRDRRDVVVQQAVEPPGGGDVPVQAVALVLGQHADPLQPAVHQVGQREVHQPVEGSERNGGFRPVRGQRPQRPARPAREHDAQHPVPSHVEEPFFLRFSGADRPRLGQPWRTAHRGNLRPDHDTRPSSQAVTLEPG